MELTCFRRSRPVDIKGRTEDGAQVGNRGLAGGAGGGEGVGGSRGKGGVGGRGGGGGGGIERRLEPPVARYSSSTLPALTRSQIFLLLHSDDDQQC